MLKGREGHVKIFKSLSISGYQLGSAKTMVLLGDGF